MTIKSRPYIDNDLPYLQDALASWLQEAGGCGYYHVGNIPHWIYGTLQGHHSVGDLVQVWEDGPNLVGMAINFLFDTAFQVFTSPAYRGTEVEIEMLQSAFETTLRFMKETKQAGASVVTDVFSCDDTRKELLARLGFEEYKLWDHINERSLSEPIPEAQLPGDFIIRSATMEDDEQLAMGRNDAFGADWTPELYRAEVMQKPGYQPNREIIVVAPDRRIAAFTVIWLDEVNKIGLFEPVGTLRDFQRRGLARALMLYALREMKKLGMEIATVEHDATNLAAFGLYQSLGFRKRYETLGYKIDT
jgi:ribosomal protein S18 acetylase RimI-like enzyme